MPALGAEGGWTWGLSAVKFVKKAENQEIGKVRLASFKMAEKEGKATCRLSDYLVGGRTSPTDRGGRAGTAFRNEQDASLCLELRVMVWE